MTKSIDEITVEINNFVSKINQDLQISPNTIFDAISTQFPEIEHDIERQRHLIEIASMVNLTTEEVQEIIQSFPYSLESIQDAIRAGAKLDKEDTGRTMEERAIYSSFGEGLRMGIVSLPQKQEYVFLVTLPDNDRRHIQAAYMEVDGATLYFEDDDHETILAFGPGHWIWAERVDSEKL